MSGGRTELAVFAVLPVTAFYVTRTIPSWRNGGTRLHFRPHIERTLSYQKYLLEELRARARVLTNLIFIGRNAGGQH